MVSYFIVTKMELFRIKTPNIMNIVVKISLLFFAILSNLGAFAQDKTESSVQEYLNENYANLSLELNDVKNWVVTDNYTSSSTGIRHFYIAQTLNGIIIENGIANITLDANDSVLYIASNLIANIERKSNKAQEPSIDALTSIKKAKQHLGISGEPGKRIDSESSNKIHFDKGDLSKEDILVELKNWYTGEEIHLAWVVTIYELSGDHWWQIFIDAENGKELHRSDWVQHCDFDSHVRPNSNTNISTLMLPAPPPGTDQYNVFALPVESPSHGTRTMEVGPFNSTASPYGWHDDNGVAGEEYTITRGNNVYAYEDVNDNNSPGYSPDGGATLDFDFPLNLSQNPSTYQDPAITNLFYTCNRIHDILYQYGFDEASGNFQSNNYGNGGAAGDYVLAEAQDGGGTNNANFATPNDGSNPRMQMYLWNNSSGTSNLLTVNTPAGIAGAYTAAEASFGPGVPSTPITADFALVDDGTSTIDDGCEPLINAAVINGKIAVLYRGNCNFVNKVLNAQDAGAVAVIVINNVAGAPTTMGGTSAAITIPSIMISQADGNSIVAQMMTGTVNGTLVNGSGSGTNDGDFDNGIILHEYGHGVSNRLTGGPSNSGCLGNAEQMGEGWSDFLSCMLTMDMSVTNPVYRPVGTYAIGEAPNGVGIRPTAYDTSYAINPFTYGDVANTAQITQPHGIGFIWATMLWDLNWAFINQYGFDANIETGTGGNNMVLQLVMEGMKLQPCSPGFTDGRDAILMADQLLYGGANQCLIWNTFAKRGLGYSASQGSTDSRSDQVEAFDLPTSCQTPLIAPTANFDANTYVTCSGVIQFEDLSTDIPQSWLWDFGDGSTSTLQNPSHTYAASGFYTVTMETTNTIGTDVLVQTNFIEVVFPQAPTVNDGTGCSSDSIMLSANGANLIHWTDLNGNLLETGNVYYTVPSASSSSYYAVNVDTAQHFNVGPVDNSFGTGGNHNTTFIGAVNFTAETELIIHSAWVFSGSTGVRQIGLYDGYDTGGTPIQVVNVDIPFTGAGRIDLGISVPSAGQYSFGVNNADLYRNDTGANYPYAIPGLISLDGSPAGSDFYYYFYDLEVSEPDCSSDSVLVSATVVAGADFSWAATVTTVDFTDLSIGATAWSWDFGDGNTSTVQNPSHTYSQTGTYTVTLTVNGVCSVVYTVNISDVGLDQVAEGDFGISLFPNPASKEIKVTLSKVLSVNSTLQIVSVDGKLIDEIEVVKGASEVVISVDKLAPQVYYLVFDYVSGQERIKFLVQR